MDDSEIDALALATKTEYFDEGTDIVKEGDKGDMFYMIEEGTVAVTKAMTGPEPLCVLKKGDFFGEKALLSSDTRAATCTSTSKLKCLVLVREDFVRMLGNLKEIIDTHEDKRQTLRQETARNNISAVLKRWNSSKYE